MRRRAAGLATTAVLIGALSAPGLASATTAAAATPSACGPHALALLVASEEDDTLTSYRPACHSVGAATETGVTPVLVAITPDAKTAYTLNFDNSDLTPVDVATGQAAATIPFGRNAFAQAMAITPNGRTLYVGIASAGRDAHSLVGITLATGHAAAPIALGPGFPIGIAITPDGRRAYVSVENSDGTHSWVLPVDLATRSVGARIPINGAAGYLAITPDGRTVYVAGDQLVPIDTATNHAGPSIPVTGLKIAISPDGSQVFVADAFANTVSAVSAATGHIRWTRTIGDFPDSLAVTPDGRTLWVANGTITPITVATGQVGPPVDIGDDATSLAITPDQAPTAQFFARHPLTHGQPATLDAAGSHGVSSPVVSYSWRFGDGTAVTTSSPVVHHTFAHPGHFQVTLMVTDADGTSTTQVFTGQTMSRNGGPSARTQHTLSVE